MNNEDNGVQCLLHQVFVFQVSRTIAPDRYENTPIQIYRKFHLQKLKFFQIKNSDIFHIAAQNIDCGFS